MEATSQFMSRQPFSFQSSQLPSPAELGLPYQNNSFRQLPSPPSTSPVSSNSITPPWTRGNGSPRGIKRSPSPMESESRPKAEAEDVRETSPSQAAGKHDNEDGSPVASDFVKKLYKMLEDNTYPDIVCWGVKGDCFVIKELDHFTKTILPRMFKHSNFASFVRQLNKYDFHKVKNTDDSPYGEHCWVFRHPDFHADGKESLENIKRKVPGHRKSERSGSSPSPPAAPGSIQALQLQLERMARQQEEMTAHIRGLESEYESVLNEMVAFQRNLTQQDGLMQNLIQYCLQYENGQRTMTPT